MPLPPSHGAGRPDAPSGAAGTGESGTRAADLDPAELAREADVLFQEALESLRRRGTRIPLATYRLQFNAGFTFDDAARLVPYLEGLGITDIYASPFFKARPGSEHGYDIVDHNALNPEIGDEAAFDRLTDTLSVHDMGLLLDFVPNHMGIGSAENAWWMDVLENGPSSLYAPFFDIDWAPLKSELENKVLLPILGDHYGRVLESGELELVHEQGAFFLRHWEQELPLNPRTYPRVLESMLPPLLTELGEESDSVLELQSILTGLRHLPPRTELQRAKVIERSREKEILKRRLATLEAESPEVARELASAVRRINGVRGEPRSFDELDALLEEQPYRLSYWRVAAEEINYRRFFDVNDLAAIRMENPSVFRLAHKLLMRLVAEGRITGLRIDHPDGLWNPAGYFTELHRAVFMEHARRELFSRAGEVSEEQSRVLERRLNQLDPLLHARFDEHRANDPDSALRRPLYLVAEKILTRGERLPSDWPIHGTSGYDFATLVGGLFVDPESEAAMSAVYERFTGRVIDFDALVYRSKKLVLQASMASELNVLAHELNRLSERDRHSRDFTLNALTDALREVLASFPVYRTYVRDDTRELAEHDRRAVELALRRALARNPTVDASVFRFLRAILLLDVPGTVAPEDRASWRTFVMHFQQLTGPVMAKGLEDTSFYVYNRLVSLNEVGGEPERYGQSVEAFHEANVERHRAWPASMLTTSTHDTKRSEDVRARISVLSEMPEEWERAVRTFRDATAAHATDVDGRRAPDPNEEYLFHQTLVGTWPFERPRGEALRDYTERLVAYMRKATKEAKVNTSWVDATPEYDAAMEAWVRGALAEDALLAELLDGFVPRVALHGMWNSLSQTVSKLAAPGVPDVYQGTELWDFSLVDPDNRRPVDLALRRRLLAELRERRPDAALARELVATATDGRIKLYVTHLALLARRRLPELFGARGDYLPLQADGSRAKHVVAFARTKDDAAVIAVAPRLTFRLCDGRSIPPVGEVWSDTWLSAPDGEWKDVFTGRWHRADASSGIRLSDLLSNFPVALLERRR